MGYNLNPQQQAFKEAYCNPTSATFGNALQSALSVGYAQEYSESITSQGTMWFSEILRDKEMLDKAEKVLTECLDMVTLNEKGMDDSGLKKIKQDTAKFVSETLGKYKYSKTSTIDINAGGENLADALVSSIERAYGKHSTK